MPPEHYLAVKKVSMKAQMVITIRKIPGIIITFAKILGFVKTNIIKIGNSRGIVIPAKILDRMNMGLHDRVQLEIENGRLIVSPAAATEDPFASISKGGWFDDPRDSHKISEELNIRRITTREPVEL